MKIVILLLLSAAFFYLYEERVSDEGFRPKEVITIPAIPSVNHDPKDSSQINRPDDRLHNPFYLKLTTEQRAGLVADLVDEMYAAVLGRRPRGQELAGKVGALVQGATLEGVYHNLVLGAEYRRREKAQISLSERNQQFVLDYFKTYLGVKLTSEQLRKWSFHAIKRLVVERSLEVIDAFERREDVSAWFAVMAESMQRDLVWKQNHRKLTNSERYFHWAQKVPLDILKNEVAFKIHTFMNSLQ